MLRSTIHAALIAAGLLLLALPVAAQDHVTCEKASGDVAIAACDRAIASGRLNSAQLAVAYQNRGVEYELKENWARALSDYDAALRINGKDANALIGRGNAYLNTDKPDQAMRDYNRAIELVPSPNAFYNRGVGYRTLKDYVRAKADFETALNLPAKGAADERGQSKARQALSDLPKR
jgi:tetratricopeptide (TPR) repeat protein